MSSKPRAYLFVGGGTGGHLYPAIAIAEQIRTQDPEAKIQFLCSNRPIDAQILTDAGEDFLAVDAAPLGRSIRAIVRFFKGWRTTQAKARETIYELLPTHSVVVVAMGGFVAPAPSWAARRLRVPVVLVNLDAIPGKANLLIARFADQVCTALPAAGKSWQVLGPIVRGAALGSREQGIEAFGLDPRKQTILVTGGSQGAESINGLMRAMLGHRPRAFDGWQVIHQFGNTGGAADLRAIYEHAGVQAWVEPYIDDMGNAWGCADLTIGRCGAGTVSEAWAAQVPAVFFPYPFHKDQHQKHNARALVEGSAAVLCEDLIDPAKNIHAHSELIEQILTEPDRLGAMARAFDSMPSSDGAAAAAHLLMSV